MRLLLDTHEWIWMHTRPERLSTHALALLQDPGNTLVVSLVSCWEISIKYAIGKFPLPRPPSEYLPRMLAAATVELLPITLDDVTHVATLPLHHRDPFDRLLIAQAQREGLPLLTADRRLAQYGVAIIAAA